MACVLLRSKWAGRGSLSADRCFLGLLDPECFFYLWDHVFDGSFSVDYYGCRTKRSTEDSDWGTLRRRPFVAASSGWVEQEIRRDFDRRTALRKLLDQLIVAQSALHAFRRARKEGDTLHFAQHESKFLRLDG